MQKRLIVWLVSFVALIVFGLALALCTGAKFIHPQTVLDALFSQNDTLEALLIRSSRLPRALCTLGVGGLLAICGTLLQGTTRNPLADPSLLGVTQGAVLMVAFISSLMPKVGLIGTMIFAFVGAFFSGMLVIAFSMQSAKNLSLGRLLLAGTALSTFFLSLASLVALVFNRSQELAFWVSGGFRTANWHYVAMLFVGVILGLPLAILLSPSINIVALGDDVATGLGVNPNKTRLYSMLLCIPLCALCVATAGNIAFLGLIVPHTMRKIFGNDYTLLVPFSFLGGATLLLFADTLATTINAPFETPIGLFSALLGVPVFILLIRRQQA